MKTLATIACLVLLFATLATAQTYTTVTGTAIVDKNGNLANGTISLKADREFGWTTDCCLSTVKHTASVVNGVFSMANVPDTAHTKPSPCFEGTIVDAQGNVIFGPDGYRCLKPTGATWSLDAYVASSIASPAGVNIPAYSLAGLATLKNLTVGITVQLLNSDGTCAGSGSSIKALCRWNGTGWDLAATDSVTGTVVDATTLVKGKVQLAGDLGGTAALPTVPGLANKLNSSAVDVDGTAAANSDARVASQKAMVTYVGAHAGGAPALSAITAPTADNALTMGAHRFNYNFTADCATGYCLSVTSAGGSAFSVPLLLVSTGASNTQKVLVAYAQGSSNGIELSSTGSLSAVGSGTIVATSTSQPTNNACAVTVKKSGGTTTCAVKLNASDQFEFGDPTVAFEQDLVTEARPAAPSSGVREFADSTANTKQSLDTSNNLYTQVRAAGARTANQFVTHVPATGIPATSAIVEADLPAANTIRSLGCGLGSPTGSALTTSETCYIVVPFGCTVTGWNILADAGTATVKTWRKATGTAIPTVSDSISTSGVAISSGTAVHSTTVTDFTSTAISANDILAFNLSAVATAKFIYFSLQCQL